MNVTTLPDLVALTVAVGGTHTLLSCSGLATVGQLSSRSGTLSPSPSSPQSEGFATRAAYPVVHVVHAELVHASQKVPHDAQSTIPASELLS